VKVRQANKVVDGLLRRRGNWKTRTVTEAFRVCGRRGKYRRKRMDAFGLSAIHAVHAMHCAMERFADCARRLLIHVAMNLFAPNQQERRSHD